MGAANPAFTTRSAGVKLLLYPSVTGSSVDFAYGIAASTMWMSTYGSSAQYFSYYAGTSLIMQIITPGVLSLPLTGSYLAFGSTLRGLSLEAAVPRKNVLEQMNQLAVLLEKRLPFQDKSIQIIRSSVSVYNVISAKWFLDRTSTIRTYIG